MSKADGARDRILARVRAGLAHQNPVRVRPLEADGTDRDVPEDLVQRFAEASLEAGADISILNGFEDVSERLDAILMQEGAGNVVVSPDAAAPPWRCARTPEHGPAAFTVRSSRTRDSIELLFTADAGITTASYALADTGTLVLVSSRQQHRLDSLVPRVHVALLRASCIVRDMTDLFPMLARDKRFDAHSAITFVRGPSRTADVELTLSIGVHGPCKVHVIVVTEPSPSLTPGPVSV
jgi:L-lactate dehydrogenase complex protein LldG